MLEGGIWTRRQGLCGGTITVLDAGETMYAVEEEEDDLKTLEIEKSKICWSVEWC